MVFSSYKWCYVSLLHLPEFTRYSNCEEIFNVQRLRLSTGVRLGVQSSGIDDKNTTVPVLIDGGFARA